MMALLLTFFLQQATCPLHPNLLIKPAKAVKIHLISGYSSHNSKAFICKETKTFPQRMNISNACYNRADRRLSTRLTRKSPE